MDREVIENQIQAGETTEEGLTIQELDEVTGGGIIVHDRSAKASINFSKPADSQSQVKLGQEKSIIGVL